jgi:hypothetical protein
MIGALLAVLLTGIPVELEPLAGFERCGVNEAEITATLAGLRARQRNLNSLKSNSLSVRASSWGTWRDHVYEPANVLDHDPATAWVEGRTGHGLGEWIEIRVAPSPSRLYGLLIIPGFAKNRGMWNNNNRPRSVEATLSCTPLIYRLRFADARRPQVFRLPETLTLERGCTIRLTITRVFKGARFRDTSITEIRVIVLEPV